MKLSFIKNNFPKCYGCIMEFEIGNKYHAMDNLDAEHISFIFAEFENYKKDWSLSNIHTDMKFLDIEEELIYRALKNIEKALKNDRLENRKEPTNEEVLRYLQENQNESYYSAREILREKAYGGKPPDGFDSWGDYWKHY